MELFQTADLSFKYGLLSRMEADCKYFIAHLGREEALWGGNVEDHIKSMKHLYASIEMDLRPDWITFEQIEKYEVLMKEKTLVENVA